MQDSILGADVNVRDWLDAAASKRATPGGGSAAALVGALAAAMGEMTLNYSLGRKSNTAEQENRLSGNLAELNRARGLLLGLMEEDQAAYAALTAARKLDDSDPAKPAQIEMARTAAIRVPQAIMAAGLAVLEIAGRVAEDANSWLLSDLAVCCELALATVRCGGYNVKVNLADVSEADRGSLIDDCEAMIARGVETLRGTLAVIERRQHS